MRRVRTASGPAQTSGERAALVTGACKLTRLTPTPANPALRANAPIFDLRFSGSGTECGCPRRVHRPGRRSARGPVRLGVGVAIDHGDGPGDEPRAVARE